MAEHGIEAVELKEIQLAAGQRNRSAVNYHFGDRAGLVNAIIDKHRVAVNAARHRLLDEYERSGSGSVRELLEAGVRPYADLIGTPSGRDFLIIVAERGTRLGTAGVFVARSRHTDSVARFNALLAARVPGTRAARQRSVARAVLTMSVLTADLARSVNRGELSAAAGRRRVGEVLDFVALALSDAGQPRR
jgi:AcrR family transcriptional regulator